MNVNPQLGPLQDNGGNTLTMALLAGSPAIDRGNNTFCASQPINNLDQRGMARPVDGNGDVNPVCDIGAYEAPVGTNPTPVLTTTPITTVTVTPRPTNTLSPTGTATPTLTASATFTPTATPTLTLHLRLRRNDVKGSISNSGHEQQYQPDQTTV